MKRVLASDRTAFEAQWNSSIMGYANGKLVLRTNDTEYSPILFETEDLNYLFFDPASSPILKIAIYHARDTGQFTLSPATGVGNVWGMGAYLAYYGAGNDSTSFSNNADRQQACQGYVATMLNVTEIFGRVLSRWAFLRAPFMFWKSGEIWSFLLFHNKVWFCIKLGRKGSRFRLYHNHRYCLQLALGEG